MRTQRNQVLTTKCLMKATHSFLTMKMGSRVEVLIWTMTEPPVFTVIRNQTAKKVESSGTFAMEALSFRDLMHTVSSNLQPCSQVGQGGQVHPTGSLQEKKVQQASGIPEKRKRATQKKKTFLIDFKDYTLNKLDVQSPVRPSVINLAKKQRAPCNDLPEDLHYTVRDLCKLFLKPLGLSQVFASSTNKDNRRESTGSNRLNPADDFEDTDAGYFDTFDQTSDDDNKSTQHVNEIDNLVAPSHVVEKIEIDYARRAKRVNVKKLKETMWHELEEHEIEKDGEVGDQPKRHISFAESIKSVGPKVDDPNVTVPFYFICLLHLANENGLELEGREDLSDFIIH
mmetsp:Transcript_7724/g.14236  ORF Transcript_7724/g.14236 Transcript_7724/m.14236 type:complete len:341 (-) Transcript_7724:1192-2214(-)